MVGSDDDGRDKTSSDCWWRAVLTPACRSWLGRWVQRVQQVRGGMRNAEWRWSFPGYARGRHSSWLVRLVKAVWAVSLIGRVRVGGQGRQWAAKSVVWAVAPGGWDVWGFWG